MRARDYIRSVYKDLMRQQTQGCGESQGAFLAAALEVVREIESPMKEETLVRLAVLELMGEYSEGASLKAVG